MSRKRIMILAVSALALVATGTSFVSWLRESTTDRFEDTRTVEDVVFQTYRQTWLGIEMRIPSDYDHYFGNDISDDETLVLDDKDVTDCLKNIQEKSAEGYRLVCSVDAWFRHVTITWSNPPTDLGLMKPIGSKDVTIDGHDGWYFTRVTNMEFNRVEQAVYVFPLRGQRLEIAFSGDEKMSAVETAIIGSLAFSDF